MLYLKQATASQSVLIGPFVDVTDGFTAETGLTIANTDIRLSANGGNMFAKTSGGGTHDELGYYAITLDATDTATVGTLQLAVSQTANALPVYHEFQVLEEVIYDALFAASANTFTGAAGSNAVRLVDLVTTTTTATTATTATNVTTVNGLAANVITAAALAADAGTEIAAAVWDRDATSSQTQGTFGQAIGDPVADATTIYQSVVTDATGDNVAVDIVAVKADTAAVLVDTGTSGVLLAATADSAALVDSVWDEVLTPGTHNVGNSSGRRLRQIDSGFNIHQGTAQAGGARTITLDTGASTIDDFYRSHLVVIEDGTGVGQAGIIWSYVGSTRVATMASTWKTNPDNTSVFVINPGVMHAATDHSIVDIGVVQAATANSVTLAATASATNGLYDPASVEILEGTGAGQQRFIIGYDGTSKVAQIDKDWRTNPDTTSVYQIVGEPTAPHVNEGFAQAGAAGTITLNSAGDSVDDTYIGQLVFIKSGTGQDQARIITDYDGGTKVATVVPNWTTTPDATSGYVMLPNGSGGVDTDVAAILVDTAEIGAAGAGLTDLGGMSTGMKAEVNVEVDGAFTTAMADSVSTDGSLATREQALYMILQFLTERKVSGTTVTVEKVDGTTDLFTLTLDSGTDPTTITRAT